MIGVLVAILISSVFVNCAVIPIRLSENEKNTGNLEFELQLPNNDTVEVDLTFKLLTYSKTLGFENSDKNHQNDTPMITTTSTEKPSTKFITVEEAIEGFRQDLIKKEKDIAGIIESDRPFYRHFKLTFDEDVEFSIRCTYDSNYKKRSLSISCYEYHEYETERILSNGEVETMRIQDVDYKTEVEYINLKNMKQVLSMDIS